MTDELKPSEDNQNLEAELPTEEDIQEFESASLGTNVISPLEDAGSNQIESNVPPSIELEISENDDKIQNSPIEIEVSHKENIEALSLDGAAVHGSNFEVESIQQDSKIVLAELENQLSDLSGKLEVITAAKEDLAQWVEGKQNSFAWKLLQSIKDEENRLSRDEKHHHETIMNFQILDPDFSSKIRSWVMKSLFIPFFLFGLIITAIELWRANSGTVQRPNPQNPAVDINVNAADAWLYENLAVTHGQIIVWISIFYTFLVIGILFAYSRKTSANRLAISTELHRLRNSEKRDAILRIERERLDSLHPQVPQILELLALGLHSPWKIDEKYLNFQGSLPNASNLPECVDVCTPTEQSSKRVFPRLVAEALNLIQIPGWRKEGFENAIQNLATEAGFGHAGEAHKELDQDQRRTGKRTMLVELSDKESVLLKIGEELIRNFALEVQERVLPTSTPEVFSLKPDPLKDLDLSDSLIGTDSTSVPWDVKLAEIAGQGAPWSPSTFSAKGKMLARHEKMPGSLFLSTEKPSKLAHGQVVAIGEVYSGTRPFEVSIRVDLSEWCHPEDLSIFQDYQPSIEELNEREEKEKHQKATVFETNLDESGLAF